MPRVFLFYKVGIPQLALGPIVHNLPSIIARHLSCEEITLTPDKVSIYSQGSEAFSILRHKIEITVLAHAFPSRVENLEKRKEAIMEDLITAMGKSLAQETTFDLFIDLGQAAWSDKH